VSTGAGIDRTENPAYEVGDLRRRVWGRVESAAGPLRAGGSVGWQRVSFGDERDDIGSVGADVSFDTRLNPAMPRNAVLASAAWERLDISSGDVLHLTSLDAQGFLGLWGQSVLALRARREGFDGPAPLYLRRLLGGGSSLRGFRAGAFTGDTMVGGTAELRLPLSSPLRVGQLGVSAFVDTGTAYDHGERLADQAWEVGYGGSVWVTLTAFRMSLAVAHGQGASTRVHFAAGVSF
jgi:outer membrane protein assembly factor BamA